MHLSELCLACRGLEVRGNCLALSKMIKKITKKCNIVCKFESDCNISAVTLDGKPPVIKPEDPVGDTLDSHLFDFQHQAHLKAHSLFFWSHFTCGIEKVVLMNNNLQVECFSTDHHCFAAVFDQHY